MKEEIKVLQHMIEFYKKFCENEEDLNPIITGTEVKALEKILKQNQQLKDRIDKAIKIIKSYNLGKYDYSIPQIGIIELFEALKGDKE